MAAALRLLKVLFLTEEFSLLNVPSMNREQFMKADNVSVVVKVKLTDDELDIVRLAGVLRGTAGGPVLTVKFQVWLVPVLLALSLHLTYQV
jgi:hypothetical protein